MVKKERKKERLMQKFSLLYRSPNLTIKRKGITPPSHQFYLISELAINVIGNRESLLPLSPIFCKGKDWFTLVNMTRKRIQIKKIDNISSRQVTFSKRRKGLFKKAQELSTLCDADIALIVFSATSKLFEYASSSMQQVIERRNRYSATHRLDHPSIDQLQMQVESDSNDTLRKKVEDKTRELRQLNGEDLQGLTLQELQKLEELLKRSLTCVSKVKDEKFMQDISTLKRKGVELIEENQKLKQVPSLIHGQRRQSLQSIISGSSYFPEEDGSDTSLTLGLPLLN